MKKNNVKRMVSKIITKVGVKSAKVDAGQACAMFYYQPKTPKQLKCKIGCEKNYNIAIYEIFVHVL